MALRNQLDRQRNKLTLERNKIDPERNQHPRIRNKPQTHTKKRIQPKRWSSSFLQCFYFIK